MNIDISNLDKAEVLAALYNNSRQQGMGFMHTEGRSNMTVEQAREELALLEGKRPYFDYLRGRVMKVDLGHSDLQTALYDRDNGQGASARALEPLMAVHA